MLAGCVVLPQQINIAAIGLEAEIKQVANNGYNAYHALQGQEIDTHLLLDDAAAKFLNVAAARLGWSARSTHRALKVARTIADLAGATTTQVAHVAEAMQYRRAVRNNP